MSMAPAEIRYQKDTRELVLVYASARFVLSAEFLRVHSPSAEVQGHNHEGGVLPRHKEQVAITAIEPCGNYAVKIHFSDGHNSGLYSWSWLQKLCTEHTELWRIYQEKIASQPSPRSGESLVRFVP